MKKMKTLISTMLCLCTMCALALPAHALEYTISAPGDPEYGKPTSFEPVVTADGGAMKNEDLSKNAALIPPGFGTPTSYMLNTGEYLTPNLVPSQMAGTGTVNGSTVSITPPSAGTLPSTSISDTAAPSPGNSGSFATAGYTEVTSAMYYSDGSLGTLKIPSIGLTVKIFQGTDSAALAKGAGHFTDTSIWTGNVALAGHNRGVRNDFGKIHTLRQGDIVTLTTALGTRTYAVTGVNKVSVNDTSGLVVSSTNMITLYTCVENQPAYRWYVTAVETV